MFEKSLSKILYVFLLLFILLLVILLAPAINIFSFIPQFYRIEYALTFSDASTFQRVFKGYYVFSDLNFKEKFLGIGPGDNTIIKLLYSGSNYRIITISDFINGFFAELVNFGLIFSMMLNFFYFYLFYIRRKNFLGFLFFSLLRMGTNINILTQSIILLSILTLIPILDEKVYSCYTYGKFCKE